MSLIENRKAKFNYEIMERYEAGLELIGSEVKMLRKGQGSLEGAYIVIRGGEAYVTGNLKLASSNALRKMRFLSYIASRHG